jgi:hypothetical protein
LAQTEEIAGRLSEQHLCGEWQKTGGPVSMRGDV